MDTITFSNIATRLKFHYEINLSLKQTISSLTFYYASCINIRIPLSSKNIDDYLVAFEDVILGRSYGGVFIEKYKADSKESYLMFDNVKYKIGRSNNPTKRLIGMRTANPSCRLICTTPLFSEKYLHDLFAHNKISHEWYNLAGSEVNLFKSLAEIDNQFAADAIMRMGIKNMKRNTITKVKEKAAFDMEKVHSKQEFYFGKYSGKKVSEMKNPKEIDYLHWAFDNLKNKKNTQLYQAISYYVNKTK